MLNHTNPMSMMVLAASRATSIPVYGMCHSVHYTVEQLAEYLEVDLARLTFRAAGVNHLAWITELWLDGEDAYPMLRGGVACPEVWEQDPVRFELMFHPRPVPDRVQRARERSLPPSDRPETLKRYARPGYRGVGLLREQLADVADRERRTARPRARRRRGVPDGARRRYPSRIVEAMATGEPVGVYVSVPNDGWIANLDGAEWSRWRRSSTARASVRSGFGAVPLAARRARSAASWNPTSP